MIMANQYNQYLRSHYSYSFLTLLYVTIFIIFIQGPIIVVAQPNQYESVIAPNNNIRPSSTTSTVLNHDDAAYDAGAEIYDDTEDLDEVSSSSSLRTTSVSQSKSTPNISSHLPAQAEEVHKNEYEDESDSYQNDMNEDNLDDETTNQDDSQLFGDTVSINRPDLKPAVLDPTHKKDPYSSSTSRLPFVALNLWRDLFSKPGILVGIIGGVIIGMLSAILLVMFIIYRMRKKDEGSYALEEGPRKSPSHAYTRVSSREFFA